MKCKVQHLANNERYRILIIDKETYIMDIEISYLRIIFPFFFWMLSNQAFKIEDQAAVERLKTEKSKETGALGKVSIIGVSYTGGMLLAPLMDYFNIPMPSFINIELLVLAIVLVSLLSFSISRSRKQKLYNVLKLEALPEKKLQLRPSSLGHFLNVLLSYLVLLGLSIFFFLGYVETQNVMVLVVASGILYGIFLLNHKTFKDGTITVKLKNE